MIKNRRRNTIIRHIVLTLLALLWLVPIIWLVVTSFSAYDGVRYSKFFPEKWSLRQYNRLFFKPDSAANYPAWFKNSLIIGVFCCIISSVFVLMVSYAFSCMRFKARKSLMSFSMEFMFSLC